jgi:hypothetical protein
LHTVGSGCPDLLVGFQGSNFLLELKTEKGTLTDDQEEWFAGWRGAIRIVRSAEQALQACGMTEV